MKCWECEIEGVDLEEHHPVPRSRGGTKTISLCSACHSKAHHRKKNVSISKLTREGLAKKMATGWKPGRHLSRYNHLGRATIQKNANEFAKKMFPIIKEIMERDKIKTYNAIAIALSRGGVETIRGNSRWHHTSVARVMERIERLGLS